ncbi:MAG TPA: glycosyltransferase family 2 protein, partial [Candidatus Saccharimonadia bacterium]|nr:glycosyltransferase family 2 protein [Candidatus Saccharimonadia bacterium]
MHLEEITPLILTFNEAANLPRVLPRLVWARDIVVVDSGSTDGTLEILAGYPQVRVVSRAFDTFACQCNFGLEQVRTEWMLSLDADYVPGDDFENELATLDANAGGYRVTFRYCVLGQPLRASLYPSRTVLYRRELARYVDEGHGHRVVVDGEIQTLHTRFDHDDRKPLQRWFQSQIRYAEMETAHLLASPADSLNRPDRIRRWIFVAPALVFFYTLLIKGLILDGLPGWHYVMQRTLAELILSLQLLHRRLEGDAPKS